MKRQKGFTLIELILVIGLFAALSSFAVVNLLKPQIETSLDTVATQITSDIKSQQIKAINGYEDSSQVVQLNQDGYTIGTLTINLDESIEIINITFPSSQIVFNKNGSIENYSDTTNSFTISHTGGNQKVISINKYGVISEN